MPRSRYPTLFLFDLDDVLCRYDRRAFTAHLAHTTRTTPDHVAAAMRASDLDLRADRGEIGPETWLETIGQRLGARLQRSDWIAARRRAMTPNLEVLTLVSLLSERHDVAVLTNDPRWVADHLGELCPPVADIVGDRVVTSAMLGATKPHPETFRRCASRLGCDPEAILFVDDVPANVAGARLAGLSAHRFRDAANLRRALRRHEVLPRSTAFEPSTAFGSSIGFGESRSLDPFDVVD